jgi:hypothetical protein
MKNVFSELSECVSSLRMELEDKAIRGEKWILNSEEFLFGEKQLPIQKKSDKKASVSPFFRNDDSINPPFVNLPVKKGLCEIVFLRLSPSRPEEENQKPYSDDGALKLNEIAQAMKLKLHLKTEVFNTYLIPSHKEYLSEDELQGGLNRFYQDMEKVKPKVVICWGERLSQLLTIQTKPVEELRKTFIKDKRGFMIMSSWDSFYLLKKPEIKRFVWDDLKKVMGFL